MEPRLSKIIRACIGACAALMALPALAAATPVATSDESYAGLGRVFPDPLAGCQQTPEDPMNPCSPNAQGNVPAEQFIQIQEFLDAIEYMNRNTDEGWNRYMEVVALDGKLGAGSGSGTDTEAGNDLPPEFDPKEEYVSAGLPQSDLSRRQSDLVVVRVTDENVPDEGKKRYALSLSIHGIERAGLEGGTRAVEDLVTAETLGTAEEPIVPEAVDPDAPSFAEVLDEAIIYFTYPNPDGWRRGSVTEGGAFFQRYNGNGVDLNRDWPDIGYSFRPYSGFSEPETRALGAYLTEVRNGEGEFAAGDDLHGQPLADALSYTLLPHGSHTFAKNERIRQTAVAIHRNSEQALSWSPIVQPNDAPRGGDVGCVPDPPVTGAPLGTACQQIYGQTWGTVYDTINYTTTGALGDWFDSSVGLDADGIDNEMSFSHLDKNIVFDPHTEQLHVDGNKALLYAHLAEIVDPPTRGFDAPGSKGYVPNLRLEREEKVSQERQGPPDTEPQPDVEDQLGTLDPSGEVVFPFEVERTQPGGGEPGIYNGGMRVDVTAANANGIGSGTAHLSVECRGCDDHPGVTDDDGWVTVSEDFNQSPAYAQSGVTVAVNRPQARAADGSPIEWRAVLSGDALGIGTPSPSAVASMDVRFTSGPATTAGETGGGDPPRQAAYDVANTDFFEDLNDSIPGTDRDFDAVDPSAVIAGEAELDGLDSLVLADEVLPGYTGPYAGEDPRGTPTGPSPDFTFANQTETMPGFGSGFPGTFEEFPFTIANSEGNKSVTVRLEWANELDDWDVTLYRLEGGDRTEVDGAGDAPPETVEEFTVQAPVPGEYVIEVTNYAAASPDFTGSVEFEPLAEYPPGGPIQTGAYRIEEKDAWISALEGFVRGGGNLVLTDGALRGLAELTGIPADAINRQTVYAGQSSFSTASDEDTTDDPLASEPETVSQEGARFQTGMRRQMFEPTPLGFAIQDVDGLDLSTARQYDVDLGAFEAADGRVAATSANSDDRDAAPVLDRVTIGEIGLGEGQIRVAGALLPQPTTVYDHEFGLEPYAPTYTGYIVMRNLLEVDAAGPDPDSDPDPDPDPDSDPDPDPDPGSGGNGNGNGGSGGGNGGSGNGDPDPEGEPEPERGRCANGQRGTREDDRLVGTRAGDDLDGRRGDDELRGRGGQDCLEGDGGRDQLRGGGGRDRLDGGHGRDELRGGGGRDEIKAADGRPDVVRCGRGRDRAVVDGRDDVRGCEKVKRRNG